VEAIDSRGAGLKFCFLFFFLFFFETQVAGLKFVLKEVEYGLVHGNFSFLF
jgi:hypothetical protein